MYQHILVPTDGTELSNQTIESAVAFATDAGARITFLYAAPDYLAKDDGALMRSVDPGFAVSAMSGDAHPVLMKAETAARAAGVPHESKFKISDRPHEAIVEAAIENNCDLIFMASRGPKSIGGLLLGSETLKVLMHASIPVLVSSVKRNSTTPDRDKAIGIILDEHRSLASVLHALRSVLNNAREQGMLPDFALLAQLVRYIREFTDRLHHPKEDTHLFAKLRLRTDTAEVALATLEREHADLTSLDGLDDALRHFEETGAAAEKGFSTALDAYTTMQWQHMSLEEQVILPAAKTFLQPEDWKDIAIAFGANGDPRFSTGSSQEFREMFGQIARLTHTLANP
jgi:hemerythrin-like domain-containing protein/nucleotide-binding universal stress UspA family protein